MRRALSRKNLWERVPRWGRRALGTVLGALPPAILLGGAFRRNLRFIEEAQRWSAEHAAEYQLSQLRRICRLAYDKTAFYKRHFDAIGFDPRAPFTLDDFVRLPFIDKETIRTHAPRMCTLPPNSPGVDRVSTGGSSGMPMSFYIGTDRSATEYAYLVAGWQRIGYRPDLPLAVFRGEIVPPDRAGLRHSYDPVLRRHYYSNFHMTDENMARYLTHVATLGPCYLLVYPSSIAALTRFVERSSTSTPENIRGILAGSEIVYPDDRAAAERVFGVPYFSWYGHSEKLVLGAACEHSTNCHIWPTYGYGELVDGQDRVVTNAGGRGEIIGTGFMNTVMPFIRYRTGDEATYVAYRCDACGRAHTLVSDIQGHRTQEMLVATDGSQICWTAINMHDDTFRGVRQFQFRQERPGEATLRIVPAEGFDSGATERIRGSLERKLAGQLAFDVEVCQEIPLTVRGKATYVDQRIGRDRDIENTAFSDEPQASRN